MNSYDRLFKRMDKIPVDKIPNLNILMSFAAKYADIPYSIFCQDSKSMLEANIICHERFGIDAVTVMSDPYAETSDFGADIEYPYNGNPICRVPLVLEHSDIKLLKVKDIGNTDRMLKRVETIEMYRSNLKGECPIIGWVEGAFAEMADLRGINQAMMDIIDEPDFAKEIMEICTEQAILFAKAQLGAGADIIGVGDAVASLVGRDLYRHLILPCEIRIIKEIHKLGGKSKLHICGNTSAILEDINSTGTDIFDLDWMVDLKTACNVLDECILISGNFDPVAVLMNGSREQIKEAVTDCATIGRDRIIVSAGCEVPSGTPVENLMVVKDTLDTLSFERK